MGGRSALCGLLLSVLAAWPSTTVLAGEKVIDVTAQVVAAKQVLAGLGLTQPREDRMGSAKHGLAEEVSQIKPVELGISPDDGEGYLLKGKLAPQVRLVVDIWQTAEAAEAYSYQLISEAELADLRDAPQGRLREGKSTVKEADVGGRACYVFEKRGALTGNNVTAFLVCRLAAGVPRHPDAGRQRRLQERMRAYLQASGDLEFYRVAGQFAVLSDQHGLTRRAGGLVKVLDANPLFTDNIAVPFTTALPADNVQRLTELSALRRGAVADGVSALLLVAKVPARGRTAWQVLNAPADGLLVRLPAPDGARSRLRALPAVKDVPIVELTRKADRAKSYYAFCLYVPPTEFGQAHAAVRQLTRTVHIAFSYETNEPGVRPHSEQVPVEVARPPVVLVHGTYDNPRYCWQEGEPSLGGVSLFQTLVQAGYRHREDGQPAVLAVDYEASQDRRGGYHSSGLSQYERQVAGPSGPISSSSFLNNAQVVYGDHQGIERAISTFRAHRFAATQADVIAHSLGGLVTRLYARGHPITRAVPDVHYSNPEACADCWYYRRDNYWRGDIHRLITLCTTHRGSDIPGLLRPYERVVADPAFQATATESAMVSTLLGTVNWLTGNGGAFRDQEPNSRELNAIGPTRIPAHAVGATCNWPDIQQSDGFYRGRLSKIYRGSPQRVLVEAFRRRGMPVTASNLNRLITAGEDTDTILMTFWQGVFGNTPNDFVVRLESALGGLKGQYTTVLPGVLHGYAPRYPKVQAVIRELLLGPANRFAPSGFPPAGGPLPNRDT